MFAKREEATLQKPGLIVMLSCEMKKQSSSISRRGQRRLTLLSLLQPRLRTLGPVVQLRSETSGQHLEGHSLVMKENGIIPLQPEPGVQFEIYEGTVHFAMEKNYVVITLC